MNKLILRLVLFASFVGMVMLGACAVPYKIILIGILAIAGGAACSCLLWSVPKDLLKQTSENVLEAQKSIDDFMDRRFPSLMTPRHLRAKPTPLVEVLASPMTYVLLFAIGMIVSIDPDLRVTDRGCFLPSTRHLFATAFQACCWIIAASGIALAVWGRAKPK